VFFRCASKFASMKSSDQDDVKHLANVDSSKDSFFLPRSSHGHEEIPSVEDWVALCAKAAVEKDPKKLLDLVSEINRLLDARRKRLLNDAVKQERK
jgi:hypothetical protein